MSVRKMMVLIAATMFLLPAMTVMAQESLTCSDIEWSSDVTEKYPGIRNACYDVVERNGNVMAKVKVKIIDMNADDISFRFVQPDDTLSGVYRIAASPGWAASIRGVRLDSGGTSYGMTMNAYVPNDRWAVIGEDETGPNLAEAAEPVEEELNPELAGAAEPIEVRTSVSESEPTADIAPSTVLPATASPLPLIGLLGAGFMALGSAIRLFRRRLRL